MISHSNLTISHRSRHSGRNSSGPLISNLSNGARQTFADDAEKRLADDGSDRSLAPEATNPPPCRLRRRRSRLSPIEAKQAPTAYAIKHTHTLILTASFLPAGSPIKCGLQIQPHPSDRRRSKVDRPVCVCVDIRRAETERAACALRRASK